MGDGPFARALCPGPLLSYLVTFSAEGEDKRKCSAKLNKSDPFVISKEGIFYKF